MNDPNSEISKIQAALAKFRSLPRDDPGWQEAFQFLDGLGLITMRVNQEELNKAIKEKEARGELILPDTFPGLTITRKVKGPGVEEQSIDNN